jgi:hypothetical protein
MEVRWGWQTSRGDTRAARRGENAGTAGASARWPEWRRGGARETVPYRGAETERGGAFGGEKDGAEMVTRAIARRRPAGGGTRQGMARPWWRARGGGSGGCCCSREAEKGRNGGHAEDGGAGAGSRRVARPVEPTARHPYAGGGERRPRGGRGLSAACAGAGRARAGASGRARQARPASAMGREARRRPS